jgi:microcystin-dependent protein
MSEPFLGMIACVPWNFPPKGWAVCNGALLPINQNQALFSLLGTFYGGDGRTNFALPNLQGRAAIHQGNGFVVGQVGGEESHTLIQGEMPLHTHQWSATTSAGSATTGAGNVLAAANIYYTGAAGGAMSATELPVVGGSQPHENRSPSLALLWIIALSGIFPSRN